MTDLNKAAEAVKVLTRQIEAFSTVGKALEGIASLEAAAVQAKATADACVAEAEKERAKLDAVRAELNDAKNQVAAAEEAAANAEAGAKQVKANAEAYAKTVIKEADAICVEKITKAKADAEAVDVASKSLLAIKQDEVNAAQAELDRINAAIAEARAKLGA
jgi:chromosome segregation ATPase